jgi:hypothetical protein
MSRLKVLLGMAAIALVIYLGTLGESASDAQDAPAKIRGQLPANWGKLGLSTEQKQKVYAVQDKYDGKIADLEKQIQQLKKQEREEMEAILTEAQKLRLREIILKKVPDVPPSKDSDK